MRKLILALGLFLGVGFSYAGPSTPVLGNQPSQDERLKAIEDRLDALEKEIHLFAADKSVEEPLTQSQLSDPEVLSWGRKSMEEIYSYSFENAKQVLSRVQRYFTTEGYDSYIKALEESKNLEAMQEKKLAVIATSTGDGTVTKKGVVNGIYTWEIEIPM